MDNNNKNNNILYNFKDLNFKAISNVFPAIITSSILAPINRLKTIIQVSPLLFKKEYKFTTNQILYKLTNEQGFFSLFRGNLANVYRLTTFICLNNFIIDQFYMFSDIKKLNRNNINTEKLDNYKRFLLVVFSSFISSIFAYPFDLFSTRMACDMSIYDTKRIYSNVLECYLKTLQYTYTDNYYNNKSLNLYKGIFPYVLNNLIQNIPISYYIINKKEKNINSVLDLINLTCLNVVLSIITHPINTYKNMIQLETALIGINSNYLNNTNSKYNIKKFINLGIKKIYGGYSYNLTIVLLNTVVYYNILIFLNQYFNIRGSSLIN